MDKETKHIANAAAALDDPYVTLNQHLYGDGDTSSKNTVHHSNCECKRCFNNMGDDA